MVWLCQQNALGKLYLLKQMGEDQLDDLELDGLITLRILDGLITLRILDGTAWVSGGLISCCYLATLTEKQAVKKEEWYE